MNVRRRIRYLMWRWFGHIKTNEAGDFRHYRDTGTWPWDKGNR